MSKSKEDTNIHAGTFELADVRLLLDKTSGISETSARLVDGKPVFHSLEIGGQTLSLKGTSGLSLHPQYTAQGQQMELGVRKENIITEQPTVIRGSAGIFNR